MKIRREEIGEIISSFGMQYAKAVILDRAIPDIDGFKPSQRQVLYTMKKMGLTGGKKAKCSKIAGQTLTYYPHGDSTAYLVMVGMTDKKESYNVPYVSGKGSFGVAYSRDLQCAHPRYPEAGLAPIAEELFDGMNENAVNMIPNFDDTEIEPELLPVKFPTLLVNPISGIAVGKSCNLPAFPLVNVCMATAGVAAGKITTPEELADIIGVPEFTTGGLLHCNKKMITELCKTGRQTFVISGVADVYSDRIEINEIPYTTTAEQIVDEIAELVREDKLREVARTHNAIDLNGLKIKVFIKRGYDSREVLNKLYRMTSLRDTVSFNIRIINNNECMDDIGVLDVINMWLEFRHNCLIRKAKFNVVKLKEKQHKLEAWTHIRGHVEEVGAEIPKKSQSGAAEWLMKTYGLDDVQADYILSMQTRSLTTDNMLKNLEQLEKAKEEVKEIEDIAQNKERRTKIIIEDLQYISKKYGKPAKTKAADVIVEGAEEKVVNDASVVIKYTKNGFVKRLTNPNDIINFKCPAGDRVLRTIEMRNNQFLLVFTYDGEMYKVLADDIDSSKGGLKQSIVDRLRLSGPEKVLWVDSAGDYTGYFNMVYPNGKGERVYYAKAAGNRMKYISMFKPAEPGKAWITQESKFFIITARRHASYVDLSGMGMLSSARVFRGATMKNGDSVVGIQPLSKVPNIDSIDINRYNKPYTISIGSDILWDNSEQEKLQEEKNRQLAEQMEIQKRKEEQAKMKQIDKLFESISTDEEQDYYE